MNNRGNINILLMVKLDRDGYIIDCSKKLLDILKYSKVDLIDTHISSIIDYTTDEYKFEAIKSIIEEDSLSVEQRIITSEKKYVYVYSQYWYEDNSENEDKSLYINFIDISENKKKKLNSLNKHLLKEKLLDEIDSNVAIFNSSEEFIYYNKLMNDFLNEIEDSYFGKRDINMFGSAISKIMREVLDNPELKYEFEHCFELSKTDKYFRIVIQGLEKGKGAIYMVDIHKEKMYQQVIENAKVGIVFEGKNGITYLNKNAYDILNIDDKNRDKEEIINKRLIDYINFEYKLKFLEEFYNPDRVIDFDQCVKTINDIDILINMYLDTIELDGEKHKIYRLKKKDLCKNDLYYKKECNGCNIDFIEKNEYDRLKNEFFANISHELRTPVNVIFSTVQLMEMIQKNSSNQNNRFNKILKQNCYRLLRLINNLIEITKIDAGHVRLTLGNYNIINIIEEITLSVADYIESKGLRLIFDTEIEEKIMACDPEKIECIVLNLLANASKFTKPGGSIEVHIEDCENNYIKLSIKDTGQGIPKDKKDIVFKRFRQVDKSLYRAHEGSGIGLSLVKSFIELHGGDISVESEEGKGSEFIIKLPIRLVEEEDVDQCEYYNSDRVIDKINIEFSDIYFNE